MFFRRYMPGLFISMLIIGLLFGSSFHLVLMPFFNGQLLHCLMIGVLFSIVNYTFASYFFNRYVTLREENESLNNSVRIDKLTNVFNRRALDTDIKGLRDTDLYAIIFLDIDNFREFNNRCGHETGDTVLTKVAATLKSSVRSYDAVYKYGGEEFVIILKDCSLGHAQMIGEKIRNLVSQIDNSPYPKITVSVGIACYEGDDRSAKEIVNEADIAMLNAKRKGKNRVETFSQYLSA